MSRYTKNIKDLYFCAVLYLYSVPIDCKAVYCDIVYNIPLKNDSDFCLALVCFWF